MELIVKSFIILPTSIINRTLEEISKLFTEYVI